jgi:shikimate kinase
MTQHNKIFLIGFMGSGKTTLGKKLANKTGYTFIDLDAFIEETENKSIQDIFNENGENYFRELEQTSLKKVINLSDKVIVSLGGGTPCFYNNMDLINQSGTSFYLKYNVGMLTSRLFKAKTERPLIKQKTEAELKAFITETLLEREPFYQKCNFIVEGNNIKVEDVLQLILR